MAKKEKDIPMPMQLGSVKKQPVGVRVVCGILKYLFLALIVVISIGPIIWAGLSSFKKYAPIQEYFLNSIIIVLVSVAVTVCFVAMCAYVVARYNFKLKTRNER